MKIHGYCIRCKRVKRVNVTSQSVLGKGIVMGTCDECIEKGSR